VPDAEYRFYLKELFEFCRGLDLSFEWGTSGVSIRVAGPHRPEPVSVLWVFEPGRSGWYGLLDVNLGFGPWTVEDNASTRSAFDEYVQEVARIPGASPVKGKGIRDYVYHFDPAAAQAADGLIKDAIQRLVNRLNE
jgi:hypothetical protein